ncbi:MAG: transketolase [TACK group archaeon]|nr:transketolase [TACK group archaeon]
MNKEEVKKLKEISYRMMLDVLLMTTEAGSGHPGGSLSSKDIVAVLFFKVMRHNPKNPSWDDRDRLVFSKGHAVPILYAALIEAGYLDRSYITGLRKLGSPLQGHPEWNPSMMIEATTGSLGNGLAIGNGIALAGKLRKKEYRVYVLMGDGELQEGTVWEAAMFSSHYALDNVVAVVDRNGLQQSGPTEKSLSVEPIAEKWRAFGWHVQEVDGHDIESLYRAFKNADAISGMPKVIIAHTTKGKGSLIGEWVTEFHGKPLSRQELEKLLPQLEQKHREEMMELDLN